MKNTKRNLYAACLIACSGATFTANAAESTNITEATPRPLYREWTVGVEGGTTGFGALGSWRFSDHLGLRVGADFLQVSQNDQEIKGIHYDTKLRLLSEPLTFDVYPWQKHSFHFSFGLQFNQNKLTGSSSESTEIIIDGTPYPIDQVGTLNLKITQQLVNPYVSIGGNFFYFDHAHHWALGGELGVAYTGDPDVSLTRTGPDSPLIDAAVKNAQKGVQDYANQYKWWPVAKLYVSFAF